MEKKLNILIVHNYYQIPGGEDTVVANEKKILEDHGHKVILYTRSNREIGKMGRVRKLILPFTTIYNLRTSKDIKRIIEHDEIDIVHVHNTLNLISPSVYYAAQKCRVPVIQTIHNYRLLCPGATFYRNGKICEDCVDKGLRCAIVHSCYRNSKVQTTICVVSTLIHRLTGIYGRINYITLTEFNKSKLLQLKEINPKRVYVKPNFVDEEISVTKREGFVFAGRIDELKGIRTLIQAWKLMGVKAPRLCICGTGPLEDWCKKQVKRFNLNIDMKGFIENAETKQIIARSCALILPTEWYEGFPMSIVEAYSCGTPVICSNLGNAGAVVEEGVTGWKFKTGRVDLLARKVMNWSDISDSVKAEYKKKYTGDINYRSLINIYTDVQKGFRKQVKK